ncbi:MAG: hypothetical protein GF398_19920 [Chitinivibrionales bacterium]|nr:hypothetical protein [Chitinivibrionales bacterium]
MYTHIGLPQKPAHFHSDQRKQRNRVPGILTDSSGAPVADARVLLLHPVDTTDTNALFNIDTAYNDNDGSFLFSSVKSGVFYLEGVSLARKLIVYKTDIEKHIDSSVDLGSLTMQQPGSLRGTVVVRKISWNKSQAGHGYFISDKAGSFPFFTKYRDRTGEENICRHADLWRLYCYLLFGCLLHHFDFSFFEPT